MGKFHNDQSVKPPYTCKCEKPVGSALTFPLLWSGEGHHTGNKTHAFTHAHFHTCLELESGVSAEMPTSICIHSVRFYPAAYSYKSSCVSCVTGATVCNSMSEAIIVNRWIHGGKKRKTVWKTLQREWTQTQEGANSSRPTYLYSLKQ